ncbi:MAG: hypothetical protein J5601_03465 [Elusimicrobiaceae bacterium]|nr:hypothetical protein [Elusimicrobiaceae bacterium]
MKKVTILLIVCILPSLLPGLPPSAKIRGGLRRCGENPKLEEIMEGLRRVVEKKGWEMPPLHVYGTPSNYPQLKTILPPIPQTITQIPSVYPLNLVEEIAGNYKLNPSILPTDREVLRLMVYTLKENDYSISSPLFTLKHVEGNVNPVFYLEFHRELKMLSQTDGKAYTVKPGDVVKVDFVHSKLLPLSKEEALAVQELRIHPSQQYLKDLVQKEVVRFFNHDYAQNVEEVAEDLERVGKKIEVSATQPRNFLFPKEIFHLVGTPNAYFEEPELSITAVGATNLVRPKTTLLISTGEGSIMKVDHNYLLEISPERIIPIYQPAPIGR